MLFAKQNWVESSHVKVANTFRAIVLGFAYNDLEHMQRIWGWLYLEKCPVFTKWACQQYIRESWGDTSLIERI